MGAEGQGQAFAEMIITKQEAVDFFEALGFKEVDSWTGKEIRKRLSRVPFIVTEDDMRDQDRKQKDFYLDLRDANGKVSFEKTLEVD